MKPLVIVDMQDYYPAATVNLVDKVLKHITKAKRYKKPIIVLEFRGFGNTKQLLKDTLASYQDCVYVGKDRCDGSKQVIEALEQLKVKSKKIQICGVYTSQCVNATAHGLYTKGFKVEIIEEACGDSNAISHDNALKHWSAGNIIKVV